MSCSIAGARASASAAPLLLVGKSGIDARERLLHAVGFMRRPDMDIADAAAVALDDARRVLGRGRERVGWPDRHDIDAKLLRLRIRFAPYRERDRRSDLAPERGNRRVGLAIDRDDFVTVGQSCARRRRALQHAIDEMAAIDLARERADARIIRAIAPEFPRHQAETVGAGADDVEQDVILIIVGREQRGVRRVQFAQQSVDAADCLRIRRCGHDRGTHGRRTRAPVEPLQQSFVVEIFLDRLHDRIVELAEIGTLAVALRLNGGGLFGVRIAAR
jgi:hypothetical protein